MNIPNPLRSQSTLSPLSYIRLAHNATLNMHIHTKYMFCTVLVFQPCPKTICLAYKLIPPPIPHSPPLPPWKNTPPPPPPLTFKRFSHSISQFCSLLYSAFCVLKKMNVFKIYDFKPHCQMNASWEHWPKFQRVAGNHSMLSRHRTWPTSSHQHWTLGVHRTLASRWQQPGNCKNNPSQREAELWIWRTPKGDFFRCKLQGGWRGNLNTV